MLAITDIFKPVQRIDNVSEDILKQHQ